MSNFAERPKAGTRVHVEFDGIVEDDLTQTGLAPKSWQVVVCDKISEEPNSEGGYSDGKLQVINWESDAVTKIADPADENWPPQAGDVWTYPDYESPRHVIFSTGGGALKFYDPHSGYAYPIRAEAPGGWELAYRPDESA